MFNAKKFAKKISRPLGVLSTLVTLVILVTLVTLLNSTSEAAQTSNSPSVWDGVTTINGTTTGSAQIIAASDFYRFDCFIINTSSTNTMYVDFGRTAIATSIPILPQQGVNCANGNVVETDYISLYDPIPGDTYYILSTHARGQ